MCPSSRSGSSTCVLHLLSMFFFFFNDTATTEIYTLSLHDALPISVSRRKLIRGMRLQVAIPARERLRVNFRSEEHTSELQSLRHLVCRLLLEKKKIRETGRTLTPPAVECAPASNGTAYSKCTLTSP